jgi:hypothetical protein
MKKKNSIKTCFLVVFHNFS